MAKLVTYTASNDFTVAARKAYRAGSEFRIEGIATNLPFILNLLSGKDFESNTIYTRYVDDHLLELAKAGNHTARFIQQEKTAAAAPLPNVPTDIPSGTSGITAPLQGTIIEINIEKGDEVYQGQQLLIMDAMKMEHVISAPTSGIVESVLVMPNEAVSEDHLLMLIEEAEVTVKEETSATTMTSTISDPTLPRQRSGSPLVLMRLGPRQLPNVTAPITEQRKKT